MNKGTMFKVGKLYKTVFSQIKVRFTAYNPNIWHSDFIKRTINHEDIFMVLGFEPLDQTLLSGKTPPQDEYPFVIKILCKEDIGYLILRDYEIEEIC